MKRLIIFILFVVIIFSVCIYASSINGIKNDYETIYYIGNNDFEKLNDGFVFFGKEQAFCLYDIGNNILEVKDVIYNEQTRFTVSYYCPQPDYIGTVHTHPFLFCDMSELDLIYLDEHPEEIMGIMCRPNKIVFFINHNNVIQKVNYEVISE